MNYYDFYSRESTSKRQESYIPAGPPVYNEWKRSQVFYLISALLFLGWPVVALTSFSGTFLYSYDQANALYANVATYSSSMPAAAHVTALILTIAMFIFWGIAVFSPGGSDCKEYLHIGWLTPSYAFYTAGLALWCYGHPWWTFGLNIGAFAFAMASYMGYRGMLTMYDLSHGAMAAKPHVVLLNKQGTDFNLIHALFYKLPVKYLVVYFFFEVIQAFFGAVTTTSNLNLSWDVRHWYTIFHCVVIILTGTIYFTYIHCDGVINFVFAGLYITLAISQKAAIASFGYIWIVTYAFGFFEIIAGLFAMSYVLHVVKYPGITLEDKHCK